MPAASWGARSSTKKAGTRSRPTWTWPIRTCASPGRAELVVGGKDRVPQVSHRGGFCRDLLRRHARVPCAVQAQRVLQAPEFPVGVAAAFREVCGNELQRGGDAQ